MALDALPPRVLSGRVFLGQAPASAHANLDALARYARPEDILRALEAARESGCGALMTLGDERVVAAMRQLHRDPAARDFQMLPIVPNVIGYVREATEYGMVGAGLRRLRRVGPLGLTGATLAGAARPHRVLRRDFPTLLDILYEVEMGELRRFRPPVVFLHQMMTDMALSYEAPAVLERFVRRIRRRFGAEPGLVTANMARLADRLQRWGIEASCIAAPVNREGLLMPVGLEESVEALRASNARLVADRLSPETPTPPEAVEWALAQPQVAAAVLEIDPLAENGAAASTRKETARAS